MKPTEQQQQAIDCQGRPLFIQAGAGTGKTATLSKRIGRQLGDRSVASVRNLMIITFTNKAAGELLGRIRAELRLRGLTSDALQIDDALISTIHAMCTTLLNEHALLSNIDPGTPVLSEEETMHLQGQVLEGLLEQRETNEDIAFLLSALRSPDAVIVFVKKLLAIQASSVVSINEFERAPKSFDPVSEYLHFCQQINSLKCSLEEASIENAGSAALRKWNEFLILQKKINKLATLKSISLIQLDRLFSEYNYAFKAGNVQKDFKKLFAEIADLFSSFAQNVYWALNQELLTVALRVVRQVYTDHQTLKQSMGVRDMNDLQKEVYKLLHNNPQIAEEYKQRFSTIMIDEFQDTDSLQVGIILEICDEGLNALTTVGDAQQAIYAFRGADIQTYRLMKHRMDQKDALMLNLDTNFRSHPDVLHFVKAIFQNREFFGDEFLDIAAGRNNAACSWIDDEDSRVRMFFVAGHSKHDDVPQTSADELFAKQAALIAEQFKELSNSGVSYGDMAVLLRSVSGKVNLLIDAFRRQDIPCVIAGGSDYFKRTEVIALVNLLCFLELPDDDEALLNVLASQIFALSDDCLLELGLVQHRFRKKTDDGKEYAMSLYEAMCYQISLLPENLDDPLIHAKKVLENALAQRSFVQVSDIVEFVVCSSGWQDSLLGQGAEGMAIQANISYFCDLLQDYIKQNGDGVCSLSQHFKELCDLAQKGMGGRGKLSSMISFGNDAVKIMTIHSSKGLEFPVVATIQSNRTNSVTGRSVKAFTENEKRFLACSSVKACVSDSDLPDSFEKTLSAAQYNSYVNYLWRQDEKEETQRLFYVALTRARDLLIYVAGDTTFEPKRNLRKGPVKDVCDAIFPEGVSTVSGKYESSDGSFFDYAYCCVGDSAEEETISSCIQQRTPGVICKRQHIEKHQKALKDMYSYSSLSELKKETQLDNCYPHLRSTKEKAETVSAIGSAFHQVAQWLIDSNARNANAKDFTFKAVEGLHERMHAAARRWGVSDDELPRLKTIISTWLASDWFKNLNNYGHCFAEYNFCTPAKNITLEGSIDLLCLEKDKEDSASAKRHARIIDYKTGLSGSGDELYERYKLQAQVYAYAVLNANLCDEVELVFLRIEDNMKSIIYKWQQDDKDTLLEDILG